MLKENLQKDLNNFLKEKNQTGVNTVRLLLAAILLKEKEKKYKTKEETLTDEEVLEVIFSEAKKRKESILEFEKGGRDDLVAKEKAELEILQKYLPEQLSDEELRKIVKEAVEKVGAKDMKDIGKIMGQVMSKVKGKADGSRVNIIAKELLKAA